MQKTGAETLERQTQLLESNSKEKEQRELQLESVSSERLEKFD